MDKKFNAGESVVKQLDLSKTKRPNQQQKRVNVDFNFEIDIRAPFFIIGKSNFVSRKLEKSALQIFNLE